MAPIAKIFHNLPELSDDFRRLLKDLMDSAPDELPSTQIRVAADLTDTPYDEGLRRMAEYADIEPITVGDLPAGRPGTDILSEYQDDARVIGRINRLERRLGRPISVEERLKLGDNDIPVLEIGEPNMWYDMIPESVSPQAYRSSALQALNLASKRKRYSQFDKEFPSSTNNISYAMNDISYASDYRKDAQRRMALEYLLEGLL